MSGDRSAESLAWVEPDGTPTEPGLHPHYALWDHESAEWDPITDPAYTAAYTAVVPSRTPSPAGDRSAESRESEGTDPLILAWREFTIRFATPSDPIRNSDTAIREAFAAGWDAAAARSDVAVLLDYRRGVADGESRASAAAAPGSVWPQWSGSIGPETMTDALRGAWELSGRPDPLAGDHEAWQGLALTVLAKLDVFRRAALAVHDPGEPGLDVERLARAMALCPPYGGTPPGSRLHLRLDAAGIAAEYARLAAPGEPSAAPVAAPVAAGDGSDAS